MAVWFDLPSVTPGSAPGLVDEIAVALAAAGVRSVALSGAERLAAVSLLLSQGVSVSAIGRRLGLNAATVSALVAQVRAGAEAAGQVA